MVVADTTAQHNPPDRTEPSLKSWKEPSEAMNKRVTSNQRPELGLGQSFPAGAAAQHLLGALPEMPGHTPD